MLLAPQPLRSCSRDCARASSPGFGGRCPAELVTASPHARRLLHELRRAHEKLRTVQVSLKLRFIEIAGTWAPDEAELDAAWEIYVELITRVAVPSLSTNTRRPSAGPPYVLLLRRMRTTVRVAAARIFAGVPAICGVPINVTPVSSACLTRVLGAVGRHRATPLRRHYASERSQQRRAAPRRT